MPLFSLEHGPAAERADILFYGAVALTLASLLLAVPAGRHLLNAGIVLAGLIGWTLLEYLLHRWVLHAIPPFDRWHAEHHARPMALIGTPTVFSAALFGGLIFAPARWALGAWPAAALMLGMLLGYLAYALVHGAVHQGAASNPWLRGRQRWHALHHRAAGEPAFFGVTSGLWDRVFGSGPTGRGPRPASSKPGPNAAASSTRSPEISEGKN